MTLIDKSAAMPLYEQLYEAYKKQILAGLLCPGTKLPATRRLAADLGIGRNTVDNAYQQLEIEGYVTAKPCSGYIVNEIDLPNEVPVSNLAAAPQRLKHQTTLARYDFGSGRVASSLFPFKAWRRCILDSMDSDSLLPSYRYPHLQGEYPLRKAICDYLFSSRGIDCLPENIVITSGLEYSIDRILGLFHTSPVVAMENPGYHTARQSFLFHGCPVVPIDVDNEGVRMDLVQASDAKLLYVTPSHQFPTGAVLSINRRLAAIEWAAKNSAYIIEDDYDSELRYNAKPSPALRSIDRSGRTIYLGTFSKSLSPSIRIAFMILPDLLMEQYLDRYHKLHNSVPTLLQNALAAFITSGSYSRHIDRLRVSNKRKNGILIRELHRVFGDRATITGAGAGQHILVNIDTALSEKDLLDSAFQAGVKLHSASKYWMITDSAPPHQVMMGYGGISAEDIPPAIELLYNLWFS